jgi:hypothetical protein
VLREADLIAAHKQGATITYRLKLSVLEEALLGFSQVFGFGVAGPAQDDAAQAEKETP